MGLILLSVRLVSVCTVQHAADFLERDQNFEFAILLGHDVEEEQKAKIIFEQPVYTDRPELIGMVLHRAARCR